MADTGICPSEVIACNMNGKDQIISTISGCNAPVNEQVMARCSCATRRVDNVISDGRMNGRLRTATCAGKLIAKVEPDVLAVRLINLVAADLNDLSAAAFDVAKKYSAALNRSRVDDILVADYIVINFTIDGGIEGVNGDRGSLNGPNNDIVGDVEIDVSAILRHHADWSTNAGTEVMRISIGCGIIGNEIVCIIIGDREIARATVADARGNGVRDRAEKIIIIDQRCNRTTTIGLSLIHI